MKQLIGLRNYMILLISQNRPVDQRYNVLYFILGIQWFNLTAHDMRSSLINAVLENHRSQATPGTLMSHVTSPSSSASMRSPIHSELASFKNASFLLLLPHQAENLVNPLSWRLMMLEFFDCFFRCCATTVRT